MRRLTLLFILLIYKSLMAQTAGFEFLASTKSSLESIIKTFASNIPDTTPVYKKYYLQLATHYSKAKGSYDGYRGAMKDCILGSDTKRKIQQCLKAKAVSIQLELDALRGVLNMAYMDAYAIKLHKTDTFDYHTPGSFFRAGLQLLLAEEDNINRTYKVNGGIYTAKAKEGRYIHGKPPFGYKKEGYGKNAHLVIDESKATIIRFIFDAYLKNTPFYMIREEAVRMGYTTRGNSILPYVLKNPIYAGMQYVKPFRELPGGLFPALHEAIIDPITWDEVQKKIAEPEREKVSLSDEIPLRGFLKCYCGRTLTAAPSRSRSGKYYYYYKCNNRRHLNLSAKQAHDKLMEILELISLPREVVIEIRMESEQMFEDRLKTNKASLQEKRKELTQEQNKLKSVEEKWIVNEISLDTYQRWHTDLNQKIVNLKAQIDRLSQDQKGLFIILFENLDKLTDLRLVYEKATTIQKHELLRMVFDSLLYYQNGIYRTTGLLGDFSRNLLILKEKKLLEVDENKKTGLKVPSGAAGRSRIEPLMRLLNLVKDIKLD